MQFRNVRAIDVTQFALEALVGNLVLLSRRQPASVLIFMLIDITKQRWKRRAELKAQTTSMAKVVYASEFLANICLIGVQRMFWVVSNCHCGFLVKKVSLTKTGGDQFPSGHPFVNSLQRNAAVIVRELRGLHRSDQRGSSLRVQEFRTSQQFRRSLRREQSLRNLGTSVCTRMFHQQLKP